MRTSILLALAALVTGCNPGGAPVTGDPTLSTDTGAGHDTDTVDTDTDAPDTDTVDTDTDAPDTDTGAVDTDTDVSIDTGADCEKLTWYADRDGDNHGAKTAIRVACTQPEGFAPTWDDCDDNAADVFPGAAEVCDGKDDDCDGTVDGSAALDATAWYVDGDGDGYGDPSTVEVACAPTASKIQVATGGDCDDVRGAINPSAGEVCDGVDDDCDGAVDEDDVCDPVSGMSVDEICGDGLDQNLDGVGCEPRGTSSSSADPSWTGVTTGDAAGYDVDLAGDVNGDGYDDFLVGAPQFWSSSTNGTTYLVYGSATAAGAPTAAPLSSAAAFTGASSGDYLGYASAGAGDVDGDGYDDFLLSSFAATDGGKADAGAVYVMFGASAPYGGTTSMTSAPATIVGRSAYDWVGSGVAGGDVDGDTYADVLVGAVGADDGGSETGSAYLFYGGTTRVSGRVTTNSADAAFVGSALATDIGDVAAMATPDLDGDGEDDVALGAWDLSTGTGPFGADTYVLYSGAARWSGNVDVASSGTEITASMDWWGYIHLADVGDVNADGYDDLAIGLDDQDPTTGQGSVYVFYGGTTPIASGLSVTDANATFVGGAGDYDMIPSSSDMNGDGTEDLLVGSPYNSNAAISAGAAYVWYGSSSLAGSYDVTTASATVEGTTEGDFLGYSIAGGQDVDGDTYGDLVLGGFGNASSTGATWLVKGAGF